MQGKIHGIRGIEYMDGVFIKHTIHELNNIDILFEGAAFLPLYKLNG